MVTCGLWIIYKLCASRVRFCSWHPAISAEEGKMKYDEDWYYTPPEPESEEDEDDDSYFQERAWEAAQYD